MTDATAWVAIFALGFLGLNWPILEIFHDAAYPYLLGFWLLLVVLVAWASRAGAPRPPTR